MVATASCRAKLGALAEDGPRPGGPRQLSSAMLVQRTFGHSEEKYAGSRDAARFFVAPRKEALGRDHTCCGPRASDTSARLDERHSDPGADEPWPARTERTPLDVGRKKRIGFADLQATHAELDRGELRCPECKRKVSEADGLRFVPAFGQAEPSLAALSCPRCRTMISIRLIAAT